MHNTKSNKHLPYLDTNAILILIFRRLKNYSDKTKFNKSNYNTIMYLKLELVPIQELTSKGNIITFNDLTFLTMNDNDNTQHILVNYSAFVLHITKFISICCMLN